MFFTNHLNKRQTRIDARRNHLGINLIAIFEYYSLRLSILENDLLNRRFGADLGACFARRVCDRIRNRTSATSRQSPRAKGAVDLTHIMVQ